MRQDVANSPGNAFDGWRRARGLTFEQLGQGYGVSAADAWKHCQAVDSKAARVPRPAAMLRIYAMTGRAVRPDHFYALPVDAVEAA